MIQTFHWSYKWWRPWKVTEDTDNSYIRVLHSWVQKFKKSTFHSVAELKKKKSDWLEKSAFFIVLFLCFDLPFDYWCELAWSYNLAQCVKWQHLCLSCTIKNKFMNKCMTAQCDGFKPLSLNLRGQANGAVNSWVGNRLPFIIITVPLNFMKLCDCTYEKINQLALNPSCSLYKYFPELPWRRLLIFVVILHL